MSGIITENELEIDLSETFKSLLKHGNLHQETILQRTDVALHLVRVFYNSTYCAILMVPSYLVTVARPLYCYSNNRIKYRFSRLFSTVTDSHCCSLNKVDKENSFFSSNYSLLLFLYTNLKYISCPQPKSVSSAIPQ